MTKPVAIPMAAPVAKRVGTSGRWRLGLSLTLTTCIWWGMLPIALVGVLHKLDPVTLTFYRFFFATVILLPVVIFKTPLADIKILQHRMIATKVLFAGMMLAFNYILYLLALDRMSPAGAQVLTQLAPILFLISGVLVFGERFSVTQLAGVLLFILGLALFFNLRIVEIYEGASDGAGKDYGIGMLLMFFAAISWAAYAVTQKQLAPYIGSIQLLFMISVIGAIFFYPLAQPWLVSELSGFEWALLIFCGLNTVVAYGCFSEALNHWDASRIGAVLPIVPVLTIAFTSIVSKYSFIDVVQEPMNSWVLVGAGLVVVGSAITSLVQVSVPDLDYSSSTKTD